MMDRWTGENEWTVPSPHFLSRVMSAYNLYTWKLSFTYALSSKRTSGPGSPHSQPKREKELGSFLRSLTMQRSLQASAINALRCAAPFLPFYGWACKVPGGKVSCRGAVEPRLGPRLV